MQKRGQVTIFIIVAIIVILVLSIGLYYRGILKTIIQKEAVIPQQIVPIEDFIQNCVSSTSISAVRLIGLQGGYVIPPPSALTTNFSTIAYGYYENRNVLASLNKIQDEISKAIELFLPICFDESKFKEFRIETEIPKAKTIISDNFISTEVEFPILISKDKFTYTLNKKYYSKVNLNLGIILKFTNQLINKEISNPNYIDLTFLTDSEYDIAILPYNDKIFVYSITDPNSKIEDIPYTFMYAKKLK